jgi:hypothetical protein
VQPSRQHHLDHDDVDLAGDVEDLKKAVGLERLAGRREPLVT